MSEVLSFTNEVNVLNCSSILPPTEGLFMELTVPIPGLPSIKSKSTKTLFILVPIMFRKVSKYEYISPLLKSILKIVLCYFFLIDKITRTAKGS